jgi:uncharacterized OB-fold protein
MNNMAEPSIPEYWRGINVRFRLEGTVCTNCTEHIFPPRIVCPKCKSTNMKPKKFSGKGTLRSYTRVYDAPRGFELQVPYVMGLVKLEEGPSVTAQIVDVKPEELKIGLDLEVIFRKISSGRGRGVVQYGFKFRPQKYLLNRSNKGD